MNAVLRIVLQALLYGAFAVALGYFSTSPAYEVLRPDEALVRLSVSHSAQLRQPCHTRTPEELAKLAPNMRAALDCPRERADVRVAIHVDGKPLVEASAAPSGLSRDGASVLYRKTTVPAGTHHIAASLADNAEGRFTFHREEDVTLAPAQVLVIDFVASQGGWVFRR